MRNAFSKDYEFVEGNALCNTALVTNTNYPASGAYVDVSGYEWVNIIIRLGTIGATFKFEVFETDGVSGATLDEIHATETEHSVEADDDDEFVTFYIETANLSEDHHFITTRITDLSSTNYASINYLLGGTRHQPVTQTVAVLPTTSQHIHAG